MIRTRRLLAGVAALLAISVVATGCDSSPFAASINGQVIRQTALNAALRQFAGNSYYVQLAKQGGSVSKAITVAGSTSGSYNSAWTADILTDMVVGVAVHEHLDQTGRQPGKVQFAATRAVDSILYGPGAWGRFSPQFRTTLVQRDADLAMVEPDLVTAAQLKSVVDMFPTELFSDVCVRTVAVDVTAPDGNVDFPASLAKAKTVAAEPSGGTGGSVTCYTAAQFEAQPLAFVLTVLGLKTGTSAPPQKRVNGYTVTAVASRVTVPIDTALGLAVTVASNASRGATAQVVARLLDGVHVKVNPLYGVWSGSAKVPYSVVAPSQPGPPALSSS